MAANLGTLLDWQSLSSAPGPRAAYFRMLHPVMRIHWRKASRHAELGAPLGIVSRSFPNEPGLPVGSGLMRPGLSPRSRPILVLPRPVSACSSSIRLDACAFVGRSSNGTFASSESVIKIRPLGPSHGSSPVNPLLWVLLNIAFVHVRLCLLVRHLPSPSLFLDQMLYSRIRRACFVRNYSMGSPRHDWQGLRDPE